MAYTPSLRNGFQIWTINTASGDNKDNPNWINFIDWICNFAMSSGHAAQVPDVVLLQEIGHSNSKKSDAPVSDVVYYLEQFATQATGRSTSYHGDSCFNPEGTGYPGGAAIAFRNDADTGFMLNAKFQFELYENRTGTHAPDAAQCPEDATLDYKYPWYALAVELVARENGRVLHAASAHFPTPGSAPNANFDRVSYQMHHAFNLTYSIEAFGGDFNAINVAYLNGTKGYYEISDGRNTHTTNSDNTNIVSGSGCLQPCNNSGPKKEDYIFARTSAQDAAPATAVPTTVPYDFVTQVSNDTPATCSSTSVPADTEVYSDHLGVGVAVFWPQTSAAGSPVAVTRPVWQ